MSATAGPHEAAAVEPDRWRLRLYVAGQTERARAALGNLNQICEQHLAGRYEIEVIDIYQQPERAQRAGITVVPTLVREQPPPRRRLAGDMADEERLIAVLELPALGLPNPDPAAGSDRR